MRLLRTEKLPVASDDDVVRVRQRARAVAVECGFSLVDQTKLVTAASEVARNTVIHGRGGAVEVDLVEQGGRRGVRLTFVDHGPGIPDLELALRDGFTTGIGLGLGLGGARRLMSEFNILSDGAGTTVTAVRWR